MPKKEAAKKTAKKKSGIGTRYQIEGNELKRLRPSCERCGNGYFMANHGDRFSCGHCGLTRYKQQS